MKTLLRIIVILFVLFVLGTICSFPLNAQTESENTSWRLAPNCFGPTIRSVLIYFGETVSLNDLKLEAPIIEDRFAYATGGMSCLSITGTMRIPLPKPSEDAIIKTCKQFPWLSTKSAKRVWYYDNGNNIAIDLYRLATDEDSILIKDADVVIVMTEAQFEGGGMALGKILLVEQPSENGWAKKSNYSNILWSQWYIADVAVHELGHFLGLDHDDPQVSHDSLSTLCALPEYYENVMSYCRNRESTSPVKADLFSLKSRVEILSYFVKRIVKADL